MPGWRTLDSTFARMWQFLIARQGRAGKFKVPEEILMSVTAYKAALWNDMGIPPDIFLFTLTQAFEE